jgi:hypothetical protein
MINDQLGYYLVGMKKFYNKTLAFMESHATGYKIQWIFNDEVYSGIDWSAPIQESLTDIYKQRALQLREQYDYLVLYFSGGADSMNILHAFIDNNIFIDEIVMQMYDPALPTLNDYDTSNANFYAEVLYSATVHLKKVQHRLNPNTKIRYQDLAKPLLELLQKEDWYEKMPLNAYITINGVARQYAQLTEDHVLKLCEKNKKVAQVVGVDKPLVWFDGKDYWAYFQDSNAMHCPPLTNNFLELFNHVYVTEFFYWTPQMPKIVIKQAQEIKLQCELDPVKKHLWSQSLKKHIGEFKELMHPIIYVPEATPHFQTDKPESKVMRAQDRWFWETANTEAKGNYLNVIRHLRSHIDSNQAIGNDIENGLKSYTSKFYKL